MNGDVPDEHSSYDCSIGTAFKNTTPVGFTRTVNTPSAVKEYCGSLL